VYISVDMEGMEGVVSRNQTMRGHGDFELARRRLTLDVNEAIKASIDAGAKEIIVCEGHADMENLLLDELNPAADLISGAMRSSLQMQGIEEGCDAMVLFGHAGGGMTVGGVLDHTYNGKKVQGLRVNGIVMNTEAVFNAMVAGYYDTPLVTIIGDKAVVSEVQAHIPSCEGVIVKTGISRLSARSIHPQRARKLIYEGVTRGLEQFESIALLKVNTPITMEIDFISSQSADVAELVPGVKRLTPRTVAYTGDAEDVFRLHELLLFRTIDEYPFGF
jgi:D-amino peptidase